MNGHEASETVKRLALETGFDAAGIVRPEVLRKGEAFIQKWVGQRRHAGMKYLEDFPRRRDRFYSDFPDAKSVIVLGVNYYSKASSEVRRGLAPSGRVARYAWGKDYHRVIAERHEILIRKLSEIFGEKMATKSCVDTQPIPERFAAVEAGLGFQGKHTGLLNSQFGPWLFLSEIVTNLELVSDPPARGDCGTCNLCQKACPTGALDRDYQMDAGRCIAYLTIEHKGEIPPALGSKMKDWVFGCDECLEVCPFTSKAKQTAWKEFLPESGVGERLDLETLSKVCSNREYEKKFAGTALLRANRKQMLRNAEWVRKNEDKNLS